MVDSSTVERIRQGKSVPYSPIVILGHVTCPACGALDSYDYMPDTVSDVLELAFSPQGMSPDSQFPVKFMRMRIDGKTSMHPLEGLDVYNERIRAEPDNERLQIKRANLLRTLCYFEEAEEAYRRVIARNPGDLEALKNLVAMAGTLGGSEECRRLLRQLKTEAELSSDPMKDKYLEYANEALSENITPGLDDVIRIYAEPVDDIGRSSSPQPTREEHLSAGHQDNSHEPSTSRRQTRIGKAEKACRKNMRKLNRKKRK